MVFGGIGVMFYGGQSSMYSLDKVMHKVDLRSAFFAMVFVLVLLVLAYLTNPSETSFRTYLTEQSFRQHLSRLEDSNQEDPNDSDDSGVHFTLTRRPSKAHQKPTDHVSSTTPFHFVNRAAVSLRTPKHVFYSFGVMTIAAVLPTGANSRPSANGQADGFMVSESWFIGAFGRWWRGGPIQAWWVDNVANTKDTERCNSGVLDMKPLDALEYYDVTHMPATSGGAPQASTPERPLQRPPLKAPRSITPPPLPKSASLPLHVSRATHDRSSSPQPPVTPAPEAARVNPPALLPSPSTIFDQSPVISEILRQITTSKATVHEARTQLKDFRAAAAEAHALIQSDLDVHRERKRNEDAARAELKTRTKTLEDSKRTAEASKREAEKRLRAAESARDNASERVERLDKEIGVLRQKMSEDEVAIVRCKEEGDEMDKEMAEQLERKRKEIKVAEEVVAALNSRTKELEESIAAEEERLRCAKEHAIMKRQDRTFFPLHAVSQPVETPLWSPIAPAVTLEETLDPHFGINTDRSTQIEVFPDAASSLPATHVQNRRSSVPEATNKFNVSPRPTNLSLGNLSNFRNQSQPVLGDGDVSQTQIVLRAAAQDEVLPTLSSDHSQSTKFSPFNDQEIDITADAPGAMPISPRSTSLIPTSLIKTLDRGGTVEDLSRSFQSESDAVLDRDWRKMHPFPVQPVENTVVLSSSPTSLTYPSFDAIDQEDPFEIRPPPPPLRHRITSDGVETERVYLGNALSANTGGQLTRARTHESDNDKVASHRRWFSSSREQKDKRGLNPEAKVFQFRKFPMFGAVQKPSSLDSVISPSSSGTSSLGIPAFLVPPPADLFSSISMRAFAPSPEEREALTRAMGSANTSLERLPTLSDVVIGSLPSSPNHVPSIVGRHGSQDVLADSSARSLLTPSFSWLQSLPRMKKPKFSPWEDDVGEGGSGERFEVPA
ncbi:hypothetical protein BDW22DRAFT_1399481 [Trametopsis cervina]|nr:hypothetical protein BDW22DRAFT_1399481 [Trametopsis cervina]